MRAFGDVRVDANVSRETVRSPEVSHCIRSALSTRAAIAALTSRGAAPSRIPESTKPRRKERPRFDKTSGSVLSVQRPTLPLPEFVRVPEPSLPAPSDGCYSPSELSVHHAGVELLKRSVRWLPGTGAVKQLQ